MAQHHVIARPGNSGVTLTELLVAMVIFITLTGSLGLLFAGAASSFRQGVQIMDNFEVVRGAMAVLENDLLGSFTSREHGDYYQFYGRPEGFMFVGLLQDGQLGRVTYVIHPTPAGDPSAPPVDQFNTVIAEPVNETLDRVHSQARAFAKEQGLSDAAAQAYGYGAADDVIAAYGITGLNPADSPPWAALGNVVEFEVLAHTASLVRYEEAGRTDLDTFKLQHPNLAADAAWPYIDPSNPTNDNPNPAGVGEGAALLNHLYAFLLSAIQPAGPATDLRELIYAMESGGGTLYAIDYGTVEEFVRAKRREFWIRRLAGDDEVVNVSPSVEFEFWRQDPDDPEDTRPAVYDYILADRILHRAHLRYPDGTGIVYFPPLIGYSGALPTIDLLHVPSAFSYGRTTEDGVELYFGYFNDPRNISGALAGNPCGSDDGTFSYQDFLFSPDETGLCMLDWVIVKASADAPYSDGTLGWPTTPRLPPTVRPGFWVMQERPQPGAADFLRWFHQIIDLPAASTRDAPATLTPL